MMDDMKTIQNMVKHSQWANQRLLQGLLTSGTLNPKIVQIMVHIVQAELVWLTRLNGNDSSHIELWPELELTDCVAISDSNHTGFESFLAKIQEDDLEKQIRYHNQAGKPFDTSARDILTHVTLHSQYHRGQVNVLLREDGKDPVNVDMINYVRYVRDI
jgi:uncharacterized damage-inducible protein DinB